jgi:hypothetical protein
MMMIARPLSTMSLVWYHIKVPSQESLEERWHGRGEGE